MMTALAMIVGMLPMSLGLSEGGEQNAPLGRAVIGGLLVATFFTLIFVPVLYTVLRKKPPAAEILDDDDMANLADAAVPSRLSVDHGAVQPSAAMLAGAETSLPFSEEYR
jgi:hypothetical protein